MEMRWRMRSQQKVTRMVECGVYRTDAGLQVRAGYGPDDLLQSQTAPDIGAARNIAEPWRRAVLAKGGFAA